MAAMEVSAGSEKIIDGIDSPDDPGPCETLSGCVEARVGGCAGACAGSPAERGGGNCRSALSHASVAGNAGSSAGLPVGRSPVQGRGGIGARCSVRLGSPTPPQTPGHVSSPSNTGRSTPCAVTADGRRFLIDASMTPCLASPLTTPGGRARATRGGAGGAANWLTAGSRLDRHEVLLARQEAQLDALREEVAVLRQCLARSGTLSPETFLVCLHRRRFVRILRAHPLGPGLTESFTEALGADELALDIARGAGPPSILALHATSRAVNQALAAVSGDLERLFSRSLVVVGGFDGQEETCTTERFDPCVGAWEPLPPMRERRSVLGAAVIAGRLYVCGGHNGTQFLDCAERFDPAAGSWEPLVPMGSRRWSAAAAAAGGRLYVCGGYDGEQELDTVECFDPSVGAWETLQPMVVPRGGACAAALGGVLYVCGGTCSNSSWYLNSAEKLTASGQWELITPMSVERGHSAVATVDGKLYMCGGCNGRARHSSSERYDPTNALWEQLPPLAECRASPAVAICAKRIYLCGGRDGSKFLSSVERFDPALDAWETLRPMSARRALAATATLDGRIYVCGGHDKTEFRRSVERFDPETGTWELLPPMRGRRSSAYACTLWSCARSVPAILEPAFAANAPSVAGGGPEAVGGPGGVGAGARGNAGAAVSAAAAGDGAGPAAAEGAASASSAGIQAGGTLVGVVEDLEELNGLQSPPSVVIGTPN